MELLCCRFLKGKFSNAGHLCSFIGSLAMHHEKSETSDLKNRLTYGGIVGAILGMIIGTMPGNEPLVGLLSMGLGAVVIASLAAFSKGFWESLCSAWELLRMSFWRW